MSRNTALTAIGLATLALWSVPAGAQDRGRDRDPVQAGATAPAAAPRQPASAEERAAYDRLDPLARSVVWGRERDVNPADPVAGVKVAEAMRQLGQYEAAVQAADGVLVAQPNNVEAMLELGRAHIARGQAFYGIAALERAQGLAPNDWRPLSLLGVAYTAVRRTDDGRDAWNRGLVLAPDNPDILTNAAMALTSQGDPAGAEALLRRAVAQPTATLKMRQNLALVLGLQGKTAEAEQILRRDLPPEAADRNLQWLRAKAGTPAEAARTWDSLQQ
jgi:Flp pilus assembly protein TadD